ncbi:MAG: thermonuclease family protein [Sedimentisphaerales bacterium]|jgi:micrococcal nuclease
MARYAISRRLRNIVAVIIMLTATTLCFLDHSCISRSVTKSLQSTQQQNSGDIPKYHGRQFTVVKVVDGDTLDIDIPDASADSGRNYSHTRIRLWGVDTPETKDPRTGPMYFGKEASDFATQKALGKQVTIYLEKEKNSRDKYHRLLAYIQLPDGKFLNEELLNEGYAYADLRFKHGLYNKYKQLESVARNQKKGLWAGVTPEQMPKWRQKREHLTAPATEIVEVNN